MDVFRNYIFVIYVKNWKETATFWPIRLHFFLKSTQATCVAATYSELPNKRAYLFSFFGILIHIKQMTKSYTLLLFFME